MGTDITCCFGRVNVRALPDTTPEPTEMSTGALALFNDRRLAIGDFVFENYRHTDKDDYDIGRNYDLFGWLAGVRRPGIKPIADLELLKSRTYDFVRWATDQHKQLPQYANMSRHQDSDWEFYKATGINMYDHSHVLYPVSVLTAFDYNEVMLIEVPDQSDDVEQKDKHYMRDPEGRTYRDEFGECWIKFINALVRDDWHFVIFSFD